MRNVHGSEETKVLQVINHNQISTSERPDLAASILPANTHCVVEVHKN